MTRDADGEAVLAGKRGGEDQRVGLEERQVLAELLLLRSGLDAGVTVVAEVKVAEEVDRQEADRLPVGSRTLRISRARDSLDVDDRARSALLRSRAAAERAGTRSSSGSTSGDDL